MNFVEKFYKSIRNRQTEVRSLSADIKKYLARKEADGLITRPQQLNAEYELIRKFGYPYAESTYYGA